MHCTDTFYISVDRVAFKEWQISGILISQTSKRNENCQEIIRRKIAELIKTLDQRKPRLAQAIRRLRNRGLELNWNSTVF